MAEKKPGKVDGTTQEPLRQFEVVGENVVVEFRIQDLVNRIGGLADASHCSGCIGCSGCKN